MSAIEPFARGSYRLLRVKGRLELCAGDDASGICLRIDDVERRVRQGRKLALARACGVRAGLRVLDGMAGLGLDGMTLATALTRTFERRNKPLPVKLPMALTVKVFTTLAARTAC